MQIWIWTGKAWTIYRVDAIAAWLRTARPSAPARVRVHARPRPALRSPLGRRTPAKRRLACVAR